jgi:DNA-binding LytR/AlgR family response regulator
MTVTDATAALPASRFVRVHKSFIVNLDYVDLVEENTVVVAGRRIRVGRLYRDDLRRRLEARRL